MKALERRLQQVSEALRHLQRLELARRHRHGQRTDLTIPGSRGMEEAEAQDALYGQAKRIGAKQLLELLQRQVRIDYYDLSIHGSSKILIFIM